MKYLVWIKHSNGVHNFLDHDILKPNKIYTHPTLTILHFVLFFSSQIQKVYLCNDHITPKSGFASG